MPPLTNLVGTTPSKSAIYMAERVHLIHVTDRFGRLSLTDLIRRGEIPNSAELHGYCGPNARFVETAVGHPHCVYFYAGRAYPSYGRVALAFSPGIEIGQFRSATPFDSGGLIKPQDRLVSAFRIDLNPNDLAQRVYYYQNAVVVPPAIWREEMARWLTFYFPSDPCDYWRKPPLADPENLYTSNGDQWTAWTWEAKLDQGPRVTLADAWTADIGYINDLDTLLTNLPLGGDALAQLADFRQRCLTPTGSDAFCEEIEEWARQSCASPT